MGKSTEIKIGDGFSAIETPKTVWIVRRIVDLPGLPQHAKLKAEGNINQEIMLSVSALKDRRLYRRAELGNA